MPRNEDFAFTTWTDGAPLKSVNNNQWRYTMGAEGGIIPEGIVLNIKSNPRCSTFHGWYCGRWAIKIQNTATSPDAAVGPLTFSANGETMELSGVGHWAWAGSWLYVFPTATEAEYSDSILDEFKEKFPVGTVLNVAASCPGGFNKNGPCAGVASQTSNVLAVQTGSFGLRFDVQTFSLLRFGSRSTLLDSLISPDLPASSVAIDTSLPASSFRARATFQDGKIYDCTGPDWTKSIPYGKNYPLRVVKEGRFHSHVDLVDLRFVEMASGTAVAQASADTLTGTFEIITW
jgi:hypothetical protein